MNFRGAPALSRESGGKDYEVLALIEGVIGTLSDTAEPEQEDDGDKSDEEPLRYELRTRFLDFVGGDIRSFLERKTSPSLNGIASSLSPLGIGKLAPCRIDSISFGWQSFQQKLLGASLGVSPMVTATCVFSLARDRFSYSLTAQPTAHTLRDTARALEEALRNIGANVPLSSLIGDLLN